MLDHLRQHHEVLPCLYSQILPPNFNWKHLSNLLGFLYNSMSKEYFSPLLMASFPHDVWMVLWEAYGDPNIPPFPGDIISLVTSAMVPPTLDEISPPETPMDSIDSVPATNASDLVQQEISCLPTLASWDDFLLDIAGLFVESHIEDVGDIIDDIHILFVEEMMQR